MSNLKVGDRVKLNVTEHDSSRWNDRFGVILSLSGTNGIVLVDNEPESSKGRGYIFGMSEMIAINDSEEILECLH